MSGIVHRDLKPDNIIVMPDQRIKIIDFGVSAPFDPSRKEAQVGDFCGTLSYMAPEILNISAYDHKCDIWSIGVILF